MKRMKPPPKPKVRLGEAKPKTANKYVVSWCLPKTKEWKKVQFEVETYPESIRWIVTLPDARISGPIGSYEGNFIFDPKTEKFLRLPVIKLGQYAAIVYKGKVYMSGYPSSQVDEYDPTMEPITKTYVQPGQKPVETTIKSNPRLVTRFN